MNFAIERTIACICAFCLCLLSAYYAGVYHERNKVKAEVKPKVQIAEVKAAAKIENVGENYEEKYNELKTVHDAAMLEYGRLRVKRCSSTTVAGPAAKPDERTEEKRPESGEINLDEIAAEVIGIGNDVDANALQVEELQKLVVVYQKACKVD